MWNVECGIRRLAPRSEQPQGLSISLVARTYEFQILNWMLLGSPQADGYELFQLRVYPQRRMVRVFEPAQNLDPVVAARQLEQVVDEREPQRLAVAILVL